MMRLGMGKGSTKGASGFESAGFRDWTDKVGFYQLNPSDFYIVSKACQLNTVDINDGLPAREEHDH